MELFIDKGARSWFAVMNTSENQPEHLAKGLKNTSEHLDPYIAINAPLSIPPPWKYSI